MNLERCVVEDIDYLSTRDMSAGFASVVLAGSGAALNWRVLVREELASEDALGEVGELFEGQKRELRMEGSMKIPTITHTKLINLLRIADP
ncbi:hypothetical protein UY3_16218 [Chelonia mydas]|uniref:Uncharacterized protein n=1 Tax=Chelonia mydas TaxID=8469 RepID=M7B3M7_CHEMY|nr:hypothetical protein UY3_16218 [Chelonia mydas]